MKLKALFVTVFVAGVVASIAIAKPPPGKGNPHASAGTTTGTTSTSTSTSTSTGTTTTTAGRKVLICHLTGNGKYVLVSVSSHSALARGKHEGNVSAAGGKCPPAKTGTGTTQTGTTGTTRSTQTTSG
jgi:hypothetical protein